MLAKVEAARKSGRNIPPDLDVLAYFLEEARQARRDENQDAVRLQRLFGAKRSSFLAYGQILCRPF